MVKDSEMKTIAELCRLGNGHGFGPRTWSKFGLPIIRIQNLNGSLDFNYFSGDPSPDWIVNPGDLLFAWAGTKGVSFGAFRWGGSKGVLNQHIFLVKPKEKIDSDWLFYALRFVTERIEKKAHGFKSTLLHVRRSDVTNQKVLAPEIKEQKQISRVLNISEKGILTLEKRLSITQKRRKALMQQLLTGKQRFPGFTKSDNREKWAFGSYPLDWPVVHIGDIADERSDRGDSKAEVLSCSKYKGFVLSREYFGKQIFSEDRSSYKIVKRGQFGYPSNHIEEGSIGLQNICDVGLVSPIYTVFAVDENKVLPEFLILVLKSEQYRHIFLVKTNASVDRRGSLRWRDFKTIKVALPKKDEQQKIVNCLKIVDSEIELLDQQLEAYQRQKRGLMQQLLTGKRRVRAPASGAS